MKSASESVVKWQRRAGEAAPDYLTGAEGTDKDQSARAIAAKEIYKSALTASFGRDSYSKGLVKSGKAGWLDGVRQKGSQNYGTGVSSAGAGNKYVTNSSRYDTARKAADSLPRGPKGSPANLARVTAVVTALRAIKVS